MWRYIIVPLLLIFSFISFSFANTSLRTNYVDYTQDANCILVWRFNSDTVDSIIDTSGNDLHGFLTGGVTYGPGKEGNGYNFDGGDDIIRRIDDSLLDPTNISIALWIRRETHTDDFPVIVTKESASTGYILHIINTDELKWKVNGDDVNALITTGLNLAVDTWYHIVAVYDGTDLILYINGASFDSNGDAGSINNSSATLSFGSYAGGTANTWFKGDLDEIIIFSDALTPAEILDLYTNGIK